jgi:AraC-like DNA-binding protein
LSTLGLFYPRLMVIAELERTEERESTDRRGMSPCQGARTLRPGPQEASGEALWSLVLAYVDAHLTEHDLSPARIAAAINISPRYLYKLCARHDLRPREWIIERRLRGARRELEGPGSRTVATIARRWGFVDPAHFSGRFRHAYAMSPRECRNLARERGLSASIRQHRAE